MVIFFTEEPSATSTSAVEAGGPSPVELTGEVLTGIASSFRCFGRLPGPLLFTIGD